MGRHKIDKLNWTVWRLALGPAFLVDGIVSIITFGWLDFGLSANVSIKQLRAVGRRVRNRKNG